MHHRYCELKIIFLLQDGARVSGVAPVCLPLKDEFSSPDAWIDKSLQVTGWGRVTNDRSFNMANYLTFGAGARTLQKVKVPVLDPKTCGRYKEFNKITQICAGGVKGKLVMYSHM